MVNAAVYSVITDQVTSGQWSMFQSVINLDNMCNVGFNCGKVFLVIQKMDGNNENKLPSPTVGRRNKVYGLRLTPSRCDVK